MGWPTVRDEVVKNLKEIDTIGKVHSFIRHSKFWDEYFSRTTSDGRLLAWEVTRRALAQELIAVQSVVGTEPFYHDEHSVLITGRLSLSDADETETIFQDLIDLVVVKFRLDNQLNSTLILPRQAQVPIIEHRSYGGVLVHYAEITFQAIERVGG